MFRNCVVVSFHEHYPVAITVVVNVFQWLQHSRTLLTIVRIYGKDQYFSNGTFDMNDRNGDCMVLKIQKLEFQSETRELEWIWLSDQTMGINSVQETVAFIGTGSQFKYQMGPHIPSDAAGTPSAVDVSSEIASSNASAEVSLWNLLRSLALRCLRASFELQISQVVLFPKVCAC